MSKGLGGQTFQLGSIIVGVIFFQDMIEINQISRLQASYVYFQDEKWF
eukprot:UN21578